MALSSSSMRSLFYNRIYNNLRDKFGPAVQVSAGYPPIADEYWQKLASCIADIAIDLVSEIKTNAQVQQGIDVKVSGSSGDSVGSTVAPGRII